MERAVGVGTSRGTAAITSWERFIVWLHMGRGPATTSHSANKRLERAARSHALAAAAQPQRWAATVSREPWATYQKTEKRSEG